VAVITTPPMPSQRFVWKNARRFLSFSGRMEMEVA
jgi:hypothetical protein